MSLIGYGAKLEINDGSSNAYQAVPDLTDIDPPDEAFKTAESKRLNLASQTLTYIPTLKDPATFSFTFELVGTTWTRLTVLKGVAKNFRITILGAATPTDDVVRIVPGFITGVKMDQVEADKIVTAKCTVQVTGPSS